MAWLQVERLSICEGSSAAGQRGGGPARRRRAAWRAGPRARVQALGMEVTVISTSPHKEKEARERLGADNFIVSKDDKQMAVRACTRARLGCQRWPRRVVRSLRFFFFVFGFLGFSLCIIWCAS